ncbi:MAG: choice-of-anchor I family protein [Pontiellaceae bacterium]|nr:choice-of-anchor I family protein [Pontiellaceae bacterium]MBN2785736.1 choice-of-anchor I family protein [Pontiellaceae bacterium]
MNYRTLFTLALACTATSAMAHSVKREKNHPAHKPASTSLSLNPLGTYASGIFDEGAAEIVAYDKASQRLFVSNANENTLDVLNIADPSAPSLITKVDLRAYGGGVNSVAVFNGVVAAACQADPKQDPGTVVFLDIDGAYIVSVQVGSLPDMLTYTPDGNAVLVANEGEPNDDYTVDPEGSVSIIDLSGGVENVTQSNVKTVSFAPFNSRLNMLRRAQVRIYGPNATVAQDLEPEYIAVDPDGRTAYVTLQENNALAMIDIKHARVKRIKSFGYKWHVLPGNGFDGSDKDDGINIENWPVAGMYEPDAIATYDVNGRTYLVTANEGDSRDYDGYSEETDVGDLVLADWLTERFPGIQENENLGRLGTTTAAPFGTVDGVQHQIFGLGARSFSIWDDRGRQIFDSGDDFEQIIAAATPDYFNASNDNNKFDNRSDNKGPEPEGVVVGQVGARMVAFIGLERVGGIMVYDVTNPRAPVFMDYVNNRDFTQDVETPEAGDLGPEGLAFIPACDSPTGTALLAVANEVSGSTTIYEVVPSE